MFWIGLGVGVVAVLVALYAALVLGAAYFYVSPIRIVQWYAPKMNGLPQVDFEVVTDDGLPLRGWHVPGHSNLILVFTHGYMMNRCEFAPFAGHFHGKGIGTVFFDTRAHGRSGGRRVGIGYTEQRDLTAVLRHLREQEPGKEFVLVGSSMGSVASMYAAVAEPQGVRGLILDAPYPTLRQAIDGWWSFCGLPKLRWLLSPIAPIGARLAKIPLDAVKPVELASELRGVKTLWMSGDRDPIATPSHMKLMAERAGGTRHLFPDCTHGQVRGKYPETFLELVDEFIATL